MLNIDINNYFFLEQQISTLSMISEGSRDPKYWSNDTENTAWHQHFRIYLHRKHYIGKIIFPNISQIFH